MSQDYTHNDLKELVHDAHDMCTNVIRQTERNLEQLYGFKRTFLEESIVFTYDELSNYSEDQIKALYEKYYIGDESDKRVTVEDMLEDLQQAKEMSNIAFNAKADYEDVENTYGEVLDERWKREHSKKAYKAKMKKIEEFEKMMQQMPEDSIEYKKAKKKVEAIRSTISMDFILDRISNMTEKEQKSVMNQFFSERYGGYVLERCANRAKKFGFPDQSWYKHYFNLEQNFLPEKYHVFNNLFLYAVMRFIAYADPYSKEDQAYVRSIISNLTGLVYHKFEDDEMRNMVIELIETYDDFFECYREKFDKDNINHPNHPERIKYSAKAEADRKNALLESMVKFGITPPEDENMSANAMQQYFNDEMDKLIKKNKEEEKVPKGEAEVTENDDGTVVINPSFIKDKFRNPVDYIDGKYYYYGEFDEDGEGDSFFKMFKYLEEHGVRNCRFMLELKNPDVPTRRVFRDLAEFQQEEIDAIREEARQNIWYYLRFCVRIRNYDGSYEPYKLNLYTASFAYTMVNTDRNILGCACRQSGKTVGMLVVASWFYNYSDKYKSIAIYGRGSISSRMYHNLLTVEILHSLPKYLLNGREQAHNIRNKQIVIADPRYISNDVKQEDFPYDLVLVDEYEFNQQLEEEFSPDGENKFFKYARFVFNSTPNDTKLDPNINAAIAKTPLFSISMFDEPIKPDGDIYIEIPTTEILTKAQMDRGKEVLENDDLYRREYLLERFTSVNPDGSTDPIYQTEADYENATAQETPEYAKEMLDKMKTEGTMSVTDFIGGDDFKPTAEPGTENTARGMSKPYKHFEARLLIHPENAFEVVGIDDPNIQCYRVVINHDCFKEYDVKEIHGPILGMEVQNIEIKGNERDTLVFDLVPETPLPAGTPLMEKGATVNVDVTLETIMEDTSSTEG